MSGPRRGARDALGEEAMEYYVYVYIDPRNYEEFFLERERVHGKKLT